MAGPATQSPPVGKDDLDKMMTSAIASKKPAARRQSGARKACPSQYLPFTLFSAAQWAQFRADTPLTLNFEEIKGLRSIGDPLDIAETERIYLPLVQLISCYIAAGRLLQQNRRRFLRQPAESGKTSPFIIGIAGSVAVGKSTTARILHALLQHNPAGAKVDLVTTDGFLYPNAVLQAQNKMQRKGFPESYDTKKLLQFLSAVKSGARKVPAPLYSHLTYDIIKNERQIIDRPDILIIEGVNVLQVNTVPGRSLPFVSDFFDFALYIDAEPQTIYQWYINRFKSLRQTAFRDPQSYFREFAVMPEKEALIIADKLWKTINLPNLEQNILPTRQRADLILHKGANHLVEAVALRRL